MKPRHKKVLEEALRLPAEARAALAGHLLESLDDSVDEDVEMAWSKEIARRIEYLVRRAINADSNHRSSDRGTSIVAFKLSQVKVRRGNDWLGRQVR